MLFNKTLQTLTSILSGDLLINSRYDIVSNFNDLNTYAQENIAGIVQLAYTADVADGVGEAYISPELLKNTSLNYALIEDVDLFTSGQVLGHSAISAYVANVGYVNDYNDTILDDQYLRRNATDLPSSNNTFDLGSAAFKWANIYATTFNGTATRAQYADVAELYTTADNDLAFGELVSIDESGTYEIMRSIEECDIKCIGIISENPALLMNSDCENGKAVALVGRVPVKITGNIKKGTPIVSSNIPGVGRAANNSSEYVYAIGRALENKTTSGIEFIECIIKR